MFSWFYTYFSKGLNSTCLFLMEVWMTEGPRVHFVMRKALFEIYTWILCLSCLHEKQTSRIQSLYTLSKLSRFGYEISVFKYTTGRYSEQPPEQPAHTSRMFHCWWTSESPRAHEAKFYGRFRLNGSVWRASKFSVFKLDWNCNFVGLLHHPFWLQLVSGTFWSLLFNFLYYIFG